MELEQPTPETIGSQTEGEQMRDFNHLKEYLPPRIAELGMSYEEFARACGLTRAMIYFYLQDRNRPDEQTAARIAHALGVPLEEVLKQYIPNRRGRRPNKKK
jgi:transcriptional regulator with XRE-family HTH domain